MNDSPLVKTVDTLDTSPFRKMIMTIGELPASFIESMTYYELLTWFCDYLQNTVIPAVNNNAEVSEELQTNFTTLHNYVENYFNNLDVQQEINNKLDVMSEDGSLTAIIKDYVDPIFEDLETQINATMDENFNAQNARIVSVEQEVASAVEGTPLVASSTSGMTDTNRIYVNSTDGHWYYWNGSVWTDGGVYQASAIGDNTVTGDSLVQGLQKSVNYETPSLTFETGRYISSGGNFQNSASGRISNGFQLNKGDVLVATVKGYSTNVAMLASYKSQVNFYPLIISEDGDVTTITYTATYSGEYYLCSIGMDPSDVKIYHKNVNYTNSNDYKLAYLQNLICDESVSVDTGYYIAYASGSKISHAVLTCTDYIEIDPYSKIQLISKTNSLYNFTNDSGLAFYDKNKTFISGVQYTQDTASYTLTPPSGSKYIRLTVTPLMKKGFTLAYYDVNYTLGKLLEKYDGASFEVNRSIGSISNAVFIGDSLTVGQYYTSASSLYRNYYNYPYFLKKMMQIDTITEIAKGGATATSWWNEFNSQITQSNSVYFVWLGTNSTFTDTIDTDCVGDDYTQYANTETGNMGKILQKINSLSNNKIILLNCFASGGHQDQTNEMLNKFAQRFNVTLVIDIINSDIRNVKYHRAYTGYVNNVHFNDKGNNFVANLVNNQFNEWLGNHDFEMIKAYQ